MRTFTYSITTPYPTVQEYLKTVQGYSRRILTRIKQNRGDILLNGEHVRMVDPLASGDMLVVTLRQECRICANSSLIIPIVYEDADVIVYNKPPFLPVHPSRNHLFDTLANAFCAHMGDDSSTFHPINRLDKDTSGLCVVAKNALSASLLSQSVIKEYTAVVCGKVFPLQGVIDAPIDRVDLVGIKRHVTANGQRAVTHYKVKQATDRYSLVKIRLETGRTHQIRVHFSYMGFPLAGDQLYGGDLSDINRQALCCSGVSFLHPMTGLAVNLCINIYQDMHKLMHNE